MSKRPSSRKSEWQPVRATSMWRVDQVFLNRLGHRIKVVVCMVNDRGDLRNQMLIAPTDDPKTAVLFAARHIGGQGNVYRHTRDARIRWNREPELLRDNELEELFADGLDESIQAIRDQMR